MQGQSKSSNKNSRIVFQVLGEEQEMNIDTFHQAFRKAGEKVLGYKKKKIGSWKERTWQKIAERKVIKNKLNKIRKG